MSIEHRVLSSEVRNNALNLFGLVVLLLSFLPLYDAHGRDNTKSVEEGIPKLYNASEKLMFGYAKPKQTCGADDKEINQEGIANGQRPDIIHKQQYLDEASFQKDAKRCMMSFEVANKLWGKKKAIFVDVRNSSEYQKSHIPNSLNIPFHQIKAKTFLKNESVVIVDNGYFMRDKLLACIELKQSGYNRVSVLDDGLLSWRKNNGELIGDYPDENLVIISPDQYNTFNVDGRWVIIDATNGNKNMAHLFTDKEVISYSELNIADKISITSSPGFKTGSNKINYLIVGDSEKESFKVDKIIRKVGADFVFLLNGGIVGYQSYVRKQKILISKAELGPVRVKPCGR